MTQTHDTALTIGSRVIVVEPLGALSRDRGTVGLVEMVPQPWPFDFWVLQAPDGRAMLARTVKGFKGIEP